MAISAEDAIKKYNVKLLKELPLDETQFFAMAQEADLFPLNIGNNIKAEKTRADKVAYFLQHVVEPSADIYLPKLLEVMKKSEVANVEKLAGDIEAALEPGAYVCMYVYTEYIYVQFVEYVILMVRSSINQCVMYELYAYIRTYVQMCVHVYMALLL